ncbi:14822_t:CDS:2 [Gigaspora margarita]|uniref:14822_t:CDS:1 n=1 Tax=Gigaspora margarita TaxID=4874 RepID=A0ABN7VIM6_GIGMA|nr:14822_t:CDS:2 [Gigaspora margarita]
MTVQVTEKNKKGACSHTNKKRKAEESEEREKNRKMLKYKEETSQNTSVEVNKANGNISPQQTEQIEMDIHTQLAEAPITNNKDTSKQSWAKIMDNDSDNLKDITSATNPWVIPSTSEMLTEYTNTESDISHNKRKETQIGLEGSTLTNEKIENVHEPNLYLDHEHKDMQTDAVLHETQTESNEVAINEESTKEENTYDKNVGNPTISSACPDKEIVMEPSDPLRDELSDLYKMAGNKENLPPVTVENSASVEDLQASMLSQVSNIELDDFKVVMHKKLNARKASSERIAE